MSSDPSGIHPSPAGWAASSHHPLVVPAGRERMDSMIKKVGVPQPSVVPARALTVIYALTQH